MMLEINNLEVHFGVIRALKGISLKVEDGEIVTLIGANGAGKSTTLRTISGLKKPTSGTIVLDGNDITNTTAQQRVEMGISQVPEGRRVFSSMTVLENLDEYLGVGIDLDKPYDQDQSYARFMYEELFRHINIKKENIHIPDGLAENPQQYCEWYEEQIKKLGGIDLQILGIGGDGHWGFNEPGSSLASRTRVQALTQQTLDDNYEAFYKKAGIDRSKMPHFAITMGIGTILETKNIIMLANGKKKAEVVAKALEGPVTSQITASAIQLHPGGITVVLDKEAASKLQNIDYYKHVENMKKEYNL
jgi:glucosamine-6-phosphate deaminase